MTKGSIGHAFTVCIRTENLNQDGFYPFVLHEISVLIEPPFGHLCYLLTDVPPQPNSPPDNVFTFGRMTICTGNLKFWLKKIGGNQRPMLGTLLSSRKFDVSVFPI